MDSNDLKYFRIAKELNEMFHEVLKNNNFIFRGNLNSFSLVSLAKETAEKGVSGLKSKEVAENHIASIEKLKLEPPKRETREKELQAWIINYAMNNNWLLPFSKNLTYVTSEMAFTKPEKIVNDILAIDDDKNICIIELKSIRDNEVKKQTIEFEIEINKNKQLFEELIELITSKKWNGKCRKIAVWPKAKGVERENKYKDVEEINYIEEAKGYKFESQPVEIEKTNTHKMEGIVPHEKFKEFQDKYGYIPASDKNDMHIIKSRMLQGIYRNEKIENKYCNYLKDNASFINFMRNRQLEQDALKEFEDIKKRGRLTDEKRLKENLLSSQPMAFNIFLPLRWDNYQIATILFKELLPELNIKSIQNIRLEYVPGDENGKSNRVIKTDNSCFDVYIEYSDLNDNISGIGIEVKYTESFSEKDDFKNTEEKKDRYLKAICNYNQQFEKQSSEEYLSLKYNQLFRNQLVAEEVIDKFNINCIQIVVHSSQDNKCLEPIKEFKNLLKRHNSFFSFTIEQVVSTILKYLSENDERKSLYESIFNRYCNYGLLNQTIFKSESQIAEEVHSKINYSFLSEISINDIPSSRNWKEIYDFAKTFDLNKADTVNTNELSIYSEIYFKKYQVIDPNLIIIQLRSVLKTYILKMNLTREQYPDKKQLQYLSSIIGRIHQIIYNQLWEGK